MAEVAAPLIDAVVVCVRLFTVDETLSATLVAALDTEFFRPVSAEDTPLCVASVVDELTFSVTALGARLVALAVVVL